MDFARSVAHPAVLNTGAPIGSTDNTLGSSDAVYQQSRKEVPFVWF